MQKHLVSLFLLFACHIVTGQQNDRDSVILLSQKLKTSNLSPSELYSINVRLGVLTFKQQRYETALKHLLHAQQLDNRYNFKAKKHLRPLADLFFQFEAYEMAISYEKKILMNSKGVYYYYACSNLGRNYLTVQNFQQGIHYYRLQLNSARKLGDSLAVAVALQNIGLAYTSADQFKISVFYLKKALICCKKAPVSRFFEGERSGIIQSIRVDIGQIYFDLGRLEDAKRVLEATIPENDYRVFDKNRSALLKTYLGLGELDQAREYIQWIEQKCDLSNVVDQLRLIDSKIRLAILQKDYLQLDKLHNKRWQLFRKFYRKGLAQKNSVSQTLTYFLTQEAKAAQKYQQEHEKILESKLELKQQQSFWLSLIAVVLLLVIALGIYVARQLYKVRQRQARLSQDKLAFENQLQEQTIKSHEANLVEFALDKDKNKQLDELIIEQLQKMVGLPEQELQQELKSFLIDLRQQKLTDEPTSNTDYSVEFLSRFRYALLEKHPDLRKSEVQLCQYIRLELSNREIAQMKNITIESVKNYKNRLKHRLNLDKEMRLSVYLKQLV